MVTLTGCTITCWSYRTQFQHVSDAFSAGTQLLSHTHKNILPVLLIPEKLVGSYIEKLFKGKCEARLVICGPLGLHVHHSLLEDLLITNVGLNQISEARDDCIGFFIELGKKTQTHTRTCGLWILDKHETKCRNFGYMSVMLCPPFLLKVWGRRQKWVCGDVSCHATPWLALNTGNYNFPYKEQVHLKASANRWQKPSQGNIICLISSTTLA